MKKTVLLTGCSKGFGHQASVEFAEQGYNVIATMRDTAGKNKGACKELEEHGAKNNLSIKVEDLDVTSTESVMGLGENLRKENTKIDVLVNNAGQMFMGPLESFSIEQFQQQWDINVVGVFRMLKAVLPSMREQKEGLIINISSVAGRKGMAGLGIYNATKFAIEGMSEALKQELEAFNIDVAVIEPGPFSTNLFNVTQSIIPARQDILEEYKHLEDNHKESQKELEQLFNSDNDITNPERVVKTIINLANTPYGKREFRTAVGIDYGVDELNKVQKALEEKDQ